jgi:hypothetical protein
VDCFRVGEIYSAFLATAAFASTQGPLGLPVRTCLSTASEAGEFAQSKSLKLAGLASDLADWSSLCGLNLLEPRLVESHTTSIIPFDDRVIFVSLLHCAEFPSRLSEVAQTLDAISGIQFLVGGRWLGEVWLLGTV